MFLTYQSSSTHHQARNNYPKLAEIFEEYRKSTPGLSLRIRWKKEFNHESIELLLSCSDLYPESVPESIMAELSSMLER